MLRFLLTFCFLCLSFVLQSQTLHAIIFANTECPGDPRNPMDIGIGQSVSGDYYRMKIEMSTIASFIGYELKTYYRVGSQEYFSKSSLEKVLNGLKCAPQDIVFFYYSGHGSRSKKEATDFPQMNLVVDPYRSKLSEEMSNYPIYNVMTRIKAKQPRLTIVIGDLCNSIAEWVTPKSISSDKSATKVSDVPVKFYKDLFLKVEGSIIAVSSKPGQTSAACANGGAFTLGFMQVLQIMVSEGMEPTWKNLLDNAILATESITKGKQTPIYDVNDLRLVSTQDNVTSSTDCITNSVNEATAQNQVNIGSSSITRDEVELSSLFTLIGSESVSEEKRIELAFYALSELFESPKTVVKVVGKDGKTIVSTKTAKAYLDWLTVTTNLYKVVPIRVKLNSNDKLTSLQIHEMYTN